MLTNGGREKVNATKTTNFALRLERNCFFFFKRERDKYPFEKKICHDALYENNLIRLFHSADNFWASFCTFLFFRKQFFHYFFPLLKNRGLPLNTIHFYIIHLQVIYF